jgi:hypothetical protein
MKHLTILVPDGQNKLSSIICTYKVFTKANAYGKEIHGEDKLIPVSGALLFIRWHLA